jgi:hypothetical protein
MDIKNGITLLSEYNKVVNGKNLYIYVGMCNNVLTKWVTQTKWNYKVKIQMNDANNDIVYIDSKNQEMFCFEKDDEDEWELF